MANKVITISSTENTNKSQQENEVYRDISMVAERKNRTQFIKDGEGNIKVRQQQMFSTARDVNVDAVFNSLRNIFSWIPGERVLNPEFGSNLHKYLYEGITQYNTEQIVAEIRGICARWEPRVNITSVVNVGNARDTDNNIVRLDVKFTIPSISKDQYTYSYTYNRAD